MATVAVVLWAMGLPGVSELARADRDEHGQILERARLPERVRPAQLDNDF
jgi:hypothetical protein